LDLFGLQLDQARALRLLHRRPTGVEEGEDLIDLGCADVFEQCQGFLPA
jgi:hypothetical protein